MPSSGVPSSGGSFRIDLDQAPQAIKELEAARDELLAIKEQAFALGKVDAGSRDSVSIEAAARLGAVAVSGPDSFVASMTAGINQIQRLIDAMSADLDEHRRAESDNAAAFRS